MAKIHKVSSEVLLKIRKSVFYLRNHETGKYMQTRKNYRFSYNNCGRNCPILGHLEVTTSGMDDYYAKWRVTSGFLFNGKDKNLGKEKPTVEWVRNARKAPVNEDL